MHTESVTNNSELAAARKMGEITSIFRRVSPDMDMDAIDIVLLIISRPGITQREAAQRVGMSSSKTQRVCRWLTKEGNKTKSGLDLINIVEDPKDLRLKRMYPKAKLRIVYTQLQEVLQ